MITAFSSGPPQSGYPALCPPFYLSPGLKYWFPKSRFIISAIAVKVQKRESVKKFQISSNDSRDRTMKTIKSIMLYARCTRQALAGRMNTPSKTLESKAEREDAINK